MSGFSTVRITVDMVENQIDKILTLKILKSCIHKKYLPKVIYKIYKDQCDYISGVLVSVEEVEKYNEANLSSYGQGQEVESGVFEYDNRKILIGWEILYSIDVSTDLLVLDIKTLID